MLRKLFDEKIIIIIDNFLNNPEEEFSLTQVASRSKISISTTLRVLDKLIKQEIIEFIIVGKSKLYKLKKSEKTLALNRLLKKEEHIQEFIERLKKDPRIKKIILETKNEKGAKFLIVGDFLQREKIASLAEEIRNKYQFRIQFVEISEKQFEDMSELYNLHKKIVWEKKN